MKITPEMKVKEALRFNEKMLDAFLWLSPEFERLQYKNLRRVLSGRITIAQAARIARIPLTEALYLLNLTAGEDEEMLSKELLLLPKEDFEYQNYNSVTKPAELLGISDTDARIHFVDVSLEVDLKQDPLPKIVRGLISLEKANDILLLRHPFDPIPLRDLFARRRGLASWAEERKPGDWYIYFYRPGIRTAAFAHPPVYNHVYARARAV